MLFWSSRSERICFCSGEESLNDGPAPESVLAGAAVASSLELFLGVDVSSLEHSHDVVVSSLELSLARR